MSNSATLFLIASLAPTVGLAQKLPEHAKNLAPYVASPQSVVDKMLEAARVKPGDTVYDLGSGDGRVLVAAVQKFKAAKAVGIEISAKLVSKAKDLIKTTGLTGRAEVVHGNLLDADISPADVVTIYLMTGSNEMLRPKLEKSLKPGARVVSHDFEVRGWAPVRVEKAYAFDRLHTIYVYEMPPPAQ